MEALAILCPCGAVIDAEDRPTAWERLNTHQQQCGCSGFLAYEAAHERDEARRRVEEYSRRIRLTCKR